MGIDLSHLDQLVAYRQRIGERPAVQKVNADRKTNTEQMLARMKAKG